MEIKLCSLIRLNLRSRDISRLPTLSERNIENHRYRVRKKFGLGADDNLQEYLSQF